MSSPSNTDPSPPPKKSKPPLSVSRRQAAPHSPTQPPAPKVPRFVVPALPHSPTSSPAPKAPRFVFPSSQRDHDERMSESNSHPRSPSPQHSSRPLSSSSNPRSFNLPPTVSQLRSRAQKDVQRKTWSRSALEKSGISQNLLHAVDAFTRDVPPIPTHIDMSRKIPIRNMRKWITDLEAPTCNDLWNNLVSVLRVDTSFEKAWPQNWDRNLCRFILGVLVSSEDHSKPRADKKQSRQAVNNAIKRELSCPIETGSSSRSKTFRDLFREKCMVGGVKLPELESGTKPAREQVHSRPHLQVPTSVFHTPGMNTASAPTATVTMSESSVQAVPMPIPLINSVTWESALTNWERTDWAAEFSKRRPDLKEASAIVLKCRVQCEGVAEWGQTAWWELKSDSMVAVLPFALAVCSPAELRWLLLDFRWMMRTFECVDYDKGMRQVPTFGYDALLILARTTKKFPLVDVEGFRLIRNALMIIAPILARDESGEPNNKPSIAHLATQLVGRLLNLKRRFPIIACLIQSIESYAPRPWLRPLTACFQEPRTDIKLAVPSNGMFTPHLISLSDDGQLLAVSGSNIKSDAPRSEERSVSTEGTQISTNVKKNIGAHKTHKVSSIAVWSVESGKLLKVIKDVPSFVRGLAIARDQSCIMAYTMASLYFWQLEHRGNSLMVRDRVEAIPKPKPRVTSVTPCIGMRRALTTASSLDSPVITLWDTERGKTLKSWYSVKSRATCVDVSLDGEYFASGHENGFIHLWHLGNQELDPVLSFKNEGVEAENGQQHVVLERVNNTPDDQRLKTLSLSFYERDGKSWLVTASQNDFIRVWELPPRNITREGRTFVSSLRTAVLLCPKVRDVQWAEKGWFFSAGDDGIARVWNLVRGEWKESQIDREKNGRSSASVSSALISCGKSTSLVATYVTKSPYVTIWNMSRFEQEWKDVRERAKLYRPYFSMLPDSVDASDIKHPDELEKLDYGTGDTGGSGGGGARSRLLKSVVDYPDNVGPVRKELGKFFRKLDMKYSTKPVGEMQPWLTMKLDGRPQQSPKLDVCFEQPVMCGESGIFKAPQSSIANGHGMELRSSVHRGRSEGVGVKSGSERERDRRGMIAALQDGAMGIFELEEAEGTWEGQFKRPRETLGNANEMGEEGEAEGGPNAVGRGGGGGGGGSNGGGGSGGGGGGGGGGDSRGGGGGNEVGGGGSRNKGDGGMRKAGVIVAKTRALMDMSMDVTQEGVR